MNLFGNLEYAGECLLGQVLRLGPAPGNDRQDPEEAFLLVLEEPLERGKLVVHRFIRSVPGPPEAGHLSHPEQVNT